MKLPSVPANLHQERAGVLAVASEVNRMGLIWRETEMVDVGIDGHIEFVDDLGRATGQLVARPRSGAARRISTTTAMTGGSIRQRSIASTGRGTLCRCSSCCTRRPRA